MEYARLRIFNEPRDESTGRTDTGPAPGAGTLAAVSTVDQGPEHGARHRLPLRGLLGGHPAKQPKPRAWAELEFDDLTQAVYDFTGDYLRRLIKQGTTPDKVAVGNEIINGFLYGSEAALIGTTNPPYFVNQADIYQSKPGGGLLWRYWQSTDPVEQGLYKQRRGTGSPTLAAAGIKAVRDTSPKTKVEIHVIVDAGRLAKTMEFWSQFLTRVRPKARTLTCSRSLTIRSGTVRPTHWMSTCTRSRRHTPTTKSTSPRPPTTASGATARHCPTHPLPTHRPGPGRRHPAGLPGPPMTWSTTRVPCVLVWEPAGYQPMFRAVPELPNTWEPHASINVFNASQAQAHP
ncbi:hypothetical protein GCM10020220_086480 [Nonomuraea rubra]